MRRIYCVLVTLLLLGSLTFLASCGSSSSGSSGGNNASGNGNMNVVLSDDPTDDWALIGVKVLNVTLTGIGSPVTVYTAPNPAPIVNLVQLDQLGELLSNAQISPGTYTGAQITISANPGDVALTVAPDPEPGFTGGTAGEQIPSGQINIAGATGSSGGLTVPVNIAFVSPITVTKNNTSVVDLEFQIGHPVFLVYDQSAGIWVVNFNGPCRHHPIWDIRRLVLRQPYGLVTSVASDGSSLTMNRVFPTEPPVNPETPVSTSQSLTIQPDSTSGTIFYDLDTGMSHIIYDFSASSLSEVGASSLSGMYVRTTARFQQNGSLIAVRMWASTSFNKVWLNPEGHVLHVDAAADTIDVTNEDGAFTPVIVNSATNFYFRTPWNAVGDATPIATGTGFLSNLYRGFKVHIEAVDPLASPLVAQTVDIEIARFSGTIAGANDSNFTYNRTFQDPADNYAVVLPYISPSSLNTVNTIQANGFVWWYFTFPTQEETGSSAIPDFVSATNGSINFGGSNCGFIGGPCAFSAWGTTYGTWGDPANPNGWSAPWTVIEPMPVPLGSVSTPWASTSSGGAFGMSVTGGSNSALVDLSTVSGASALVYQVDFTGGSVTVTPQNIQGGLPSNVSSALSTIGETVKAFGVPNVDGSIQGYALFYETIDGLPDAAMRRHSAR
ncbi:MAG: hypothetical protein ABSD20_00230 [Terriglobales bacterium]